MSKGAYVLFLLGIAYFVFASLLMIVISVDFYLTAKKFQSIEQRLEQLEKSSE